MWFGRIRAIDQSERHLTFPLRAALVPWRIAIITADLPGARQRFTAEETDVLVRAVKDREVTLGAFDMDCGCMKRPARVAACSRGGVENGSVKSDIPASCGLLR